MNYQVVILRYLSIGGTSEAENAVGQRCALCDTLGSVCPLLSVTCDIPAAATGAHSEAVKPTYCGHSEVGKLRMGFIDVYMYTAMYSFPLWVK